MFIFPRFSFSGWKDWGLDWSSSDKSKCARSGVFFSKDTLKILTSFPRVLVYSSSFDLLLSLYKKHITQWWNSDCCWTLIKNKAKNVVLGFMNCVIEKIWFIVLESLSFCSTTITFHITGNWFRHSQNSSIVKLLFGIFEAKHRLKFNTGKTTSKTSYVFLENLRWQSSHAQITFTI